MSRGFTPFRVIAKQAVDELRRELLERRGSSEAGATMCSGSMPGRR
jgi:hypothetical protein